MISLKDIPLPPSIPNRVGWLFVAVQNQNTVIQSGLCGALKNGASLESLGYSTTLVTVNFIMIR